MNIQVTIPDDVLQQLEKGWDDLPQRALEALAVEGYRAGLLTSAQVQRMLNHVSRWQTDAFLKAHNCFLDYTEADLAQDITSIKKVAEK